MATEALPDTLHLYGELRIEPDNIGVVRPVTADSKRLEDTRGSRDFLEFLHPEVILQGDRLLTDIDSLLILQESLSAYSISRVDKILDVACDDGYCFRAVAVPCSR